MIRPILLFVFLLGVTLQSFGCGEETRQSTRAALPSGNGASSAKATAVQVQENCKQNCEVLALIHFCTSANDESTTDTYNELQCVSDCLSNYAEGEERLQICVVAETNNDKCVKTASCEQLIEGIDLPPCFNSLITPTQCINENVQEGMFCDWDGTSTTDSLFCNGQCAVCPEHANGFTCGEEGQCEVTSCFEGYERVDSSTCAPQ